MTAERTSGVSNFGNVLRRIFLKAGTTGDTIILIGLMQPAGTGNTAVPLFSA